jgi:hypothetical protein
MQLATHRHSAQLVRRAWQGRHLFHDRQTCLWTAATSKTKQNSTNQILFSSDWSQTANHRTNPKREGGGRPTISQIFSFLSLTCSLQSDNHAQQLRISLSYSYYQFATNLNSTPAKKKNQKNQMQTN